jgi:hypothetical protein
MPPQWGGIFVCAVGRLMRTTVRQTLPTAEFGRRSAAQAPAG